MTILRATLVSLPHAYSSILINRVVTRDGSVETELPNKGIEDVYVNVEIQTTQYGDVIIENLTDGSTLTIRDLKESDVVEINSSTGEIKGIDDPYERIEETGEVLKIRYGKTKYNIMGNCVIVFRYQFKIGRM